jgi:DNA-binding winged helix-turn-helix (wHTH) protein
MNDVSQPRRTDAVPVRDLDEILETFSALGTCCPVRLGAHPWVCPYGVLLKSRPLKSSRQAVGVHAARAHGWCPMSGSLATGSPPRGAPVIEFGSFRLDATRRRLELDGERVRVGDRALDILVALATRPGEVVSHRELIDQAWPGMVAGGGALRFHITALRKALGDPALIHNVQGRGYCLASPTKETPGAASAPPVSASVGRAEQARTAKE